MSDFAFDGPLLTDEARLERAGRDFGGMVEREPRAVLEARSIEDLQRAVAFARREKIALSARGQGHCTRGQAQAAGGLVVDMRSFDQVEVGRGWVSVGAGCRWDELLRQTIETGQTPPTLTDYLGLSVGGTLSVGGVGGQSFRWGMQTDNVDCLSVVTGAGELIECSRDRHSNLFDACRGGLGQFGIIVGARLKLVPAPARVRVFDFHYRDMRSFLDDQALLIGDGRFDYVLGNVLPGEQGFHFAIEAVKYDCPPSFDETLAFAGLSAIPERTERRESDYWSYANRLADIVEQLKGSASEPAFHPWMDLFVGASRMAELFEIAFEQFEPVQLQSGYMMTYPLQRSVCSTPFLGLPNEPHCYLFDVLPHFSGRDRGALERFERGCRNVFRAARELDVSVYPIGYPIGEMSERDWKRQLGSDWSRMLEAKAEFDPESILAPGPQVFPRMTRSGTLPSVG